MMENDYEKVCSTRLPCGLCMITQSLCPFTSERNVHDIPINHCEEKTSSRYVITPEGSKKTTTTIERRFER